MATAFSAVLEEEVIPAQLLDMGGDRVISGPRAKFAGEGLVPGRKEMGTDPDALVGLHENDLALHPEGLGPLRRKANPIPWFDRGGLGRIHRCLNAATAMAS